MRRVNIRSFSTWLVHCLPDDQQFAELITDGQMIVVRPPHNRSINGFCWIADVQRIYTKVFFLFFFCVCWGAFSVPIWFSISETKQMKWNIGHFRYTKWRWINKPKTRTITKDSSNRWGWNFLCLISRTCARPLYGQRTRSIPFHAKEKQNFIFSKWMRTVRCSLLRF